MVRTVLQQNRLYKEHTPLSVRPYDLYNLTSTGNLPLVDDLATYYNLPSPTLHLAFDEPVMRHGVRPDRPVGEHDV